jgi:NAD(P)-dependent dehydrogenase (short-subunit alcohol dehydrogenase family)
MLSRPVCLVTGSSSGIGAAIVAEFAARGYDVVVNYNSGADRAEKIAAEIRADHGVAALVLGADLADAEAAFALVDGAYDHYGRLDVVVSNSGVANYVQDEQGNLVRYRFSETPIGHLDKEMDRVLSLNLMGAYRLAQRALQKNGRPGRKRNRATPSQHSLYHLDIRYRPREHAHSLRGQQVGAQSRGHRRRLRRRPLQYHRQRPATRRDRHAADGAPLWH